MTNVDVVVVGAGILGASTAYFLRKSGVNKVLLIERGDPASGGTGKSAAIVRSYYSVPVMARLAQEAVSLFHNLEAEIGVDGGFHATGFTQLVPPDWVNTAKELVAMHQSLGVDTDFVPDSDWEKRFPWLEYDGIGAIVFEASSGYADPVQTTEGFVAAFQRDGGEFRSRTPVRSLMRDGDRISGVVLEQENITAGVVVNAAGPWSRFLAESVELDLPIHSVREQDSVCEVPTGRPLPTTPVSNPIEATYMRPMGEGRWLFGRGYPKPYFVVDPYNYKESADENFVLDLRDRWCQRIPSLQGSKLLHAYAALYDVTPDWIPFVGPREGLEGYCDAAGGSGHAFKTGPIFGRELAEWIVNNNVRDDFRHFSYDRLASGNSFNQAFGGNRV